MAEHNDAVGSGSDLSAGSLDLRKYIRTIFKRLPVFLLVFVVLMGGAALWTYRQARIYEATCTIVIEPMAPQVLENVKEVVALGAGMFSGNREFYETQFRILKSREVAQKVIDRLGLAQDPDFPDPGARARRGADVDLVELMLRNVTVANLRDSRVAAITVSDRDPERAARIANAFGDAYMEHNLNFKLAGSKAAGSWLTEQAQGARQRLETSEMSLFEFRKDKNLLDVNLDARQSMTTKNLDAFNAKLADTRARRVELEAQRKLILLARDDIEERERLPEVRRSPIVQRLQEAYIDLQKLRADLESKYGDKHPKMENINRQMQSIRASYTKEVDNILRAYDTDFQAVVETEKALTRLMEQEKRQAMDLSRLEVDYRRLYRDTENNRRVFELLTNRQQETDLTGLIRTNNVRILDSAKPPVAPARPKVALNLTMGLVLGALLGIASAFAVEALDNTIKSQEDIANIIAAPVLGLIPIILEKGDTRARSGKKKKIDPRTRDLGVFLDPKSSSAEHCRSLRTNLMFMSPDKPIHTLVVTSPGPQEGKTTTAISLAITMATAGNKVLLVDTDMRRPRIHKSFGLPNDVGISSVILGTATLDEAVRHTEVPNLFLLTCGPVPPNPAELLHTERFKAVVTAAKERFERVILDSPPTSAVTDPAIMAHESDGVLLVLRGGRTSREAARFAYKQLIDANAKVLGVVINQIDLSSRAYSYYYYHYYYYRSYSQYGQYTSNEQNA